MKQRVAFITGVNGGIGQALCSEFQNEGWYVVGSDKDEAPRARMDAYVAIDLARLCSDEAYRNESLASVQVALPAEEIGVLINNAALQIVEPVEELDSEDWHRTLQVNVIAPFLLAQAFLPQLMKNNGSVINIASIHAALTKPRFVAYATSKSALIGLTRSLAVELGGRVRVNAISPAAIATPMLCAGFDGNPDGLDQLALFHPSRTIGDGRDVAQAAIYLANSSAAFLNGAVIGIDGGIGSRLHDPD